MRTVIITACIALASVAASATTTPLPALTTWSQVSWECPGRQRSLIEIEQTAQGVSGYQTKVVGLMISGRKIDPATIAGLAELLARRNILRPVAAYCDSDGEHFGIEESGFGRNAFEAKRRLFYIRYAPRPKS